jgi:hypothetical protein
MKEMPQNEQEAHITAVVSRQAAGVRGTNEENATESTAGSYHSGHLLSGSRSCALRAAAPTWSSPTEGELRAG